MSLHVALIDKSEIIQKMLSHCLYYFSAEVLRFDHLEDSKLHFADKKPDVVFVDWEVKKGDEAAVYSITEEMKPIPVVLLYRLASNTQVDAVSFDKIPHRIKKPLDPKTVRDKFMELVPQVKESTIHHFLKFPKSKVMEQSLGSESQKDTVADGHSTTSSVKEKDKTESIPYSKPEVKTPAFDLSQKDAVADGHSTTSFVKEKDKTESIPYSKPEVKTPAFDLKTKTVNKESEGIKQPFDPVNTDNQAEEKPQTFLSLQSVEEEIEKIKPREKKIEMDSISNKTNKEMSLEELEIDENRKKSEDAVKSPPNLDKTLSRSKEFNIDENTQNDLAPMAIKSSDSAHEKSLASQNIELSEKDILKVINKYKDTLEFQQLMEKVLSGYAGETVTKLLQYNKATDILQKSLVEFKESEQFKNLVERQISEYLKKQLPLTIKGIVEQEIKKIIGD